MDVLARNLQKVGGDFIPAHAAGEVGRYVTRGNARAAGGRPPKVNLAEDDAFTEIHVKTPRLVRRMIKPATPGNPSFAQRPN